MSQPALILHVRFRSPLSLDEVMNIVDERATEFQALSGLQQKYYAEDVSTGEYAGIYLWESQEAMAAFNESELRASIAQAYQVQGAPRIEVYRVVKTLRE